VANAFFREVHQRRETSTTEKSVLLAMEKSYLALNRFPNRFNKTQDKKSYRAMKTPFGQRYTGEDIAIIKQY